MAKEETIPEKLETPLIKNLSKNMTLLMERQKEEGLARNSLKL